MNLHIEPFLHHLESLLRAEPQGYSEYALITTLRAQGFSRFESDLSDNLQLFRTHFLLFHCLYRLRDQLRESARGELAISVFRIALEPFRPGAEGLQRNEPLREYYLDLGHLEQTSGEDVAQLLDSFFSGIARSGQREQALEVLGLCDPVDPQTIKQRYRRLAMEHHPDRGGDTERLQELNAAMAILCD